MGSDTVFCNEAIDLLNDAGFLFCAMSLLGFFCFCKLPFEPGYLVNQ